MNAEINAIHKQQVSRHRDSGRIVYLLCQTHVTV